MPPNRGHNIFNARAAGPAMASAARRACLFEQSNFIDINGVISLDRQEGYCRKRHAIGEAFEGA
jgi:hypothetical protein